MTTVCLWRNSIYFKYFIMVILILLFGALFGLLIRYADLNRFDVISGDATLKDFTVAKTVLLIIGAGAILLSIEIAFGLASYHVKPFILGGVVLGGMLFGIGMAILGYCPGTLPVSMGEGSIDAFVGILGGLTGGLAFTWSLPTIQPVLGPDYGKISLNSLTDTHPVLFFILVMIISVSFIALAFVLHQYEKRTVKDRDVNYRWVVTSIGMAILNGIVFLKVTSNRPIGASTSYPYLSDSITHFTQNAYFEKVKVPGHWEYVFLIGAFLASFVLALVKGEFKLKAVYSHWEEAKGPSVSKRLVWAFMAGFILIFGARMAGGCTSGHIISGGMQLAVSSLVFGIFVFSAFLITGRLFYKKKSLTIKTQ